MFRRLPYFLFVLSFSFGFSFPVISEIEYLGSYGGRVADFEVYCSNSGEMYAYVARGTSLLVLDTRSLNEPKIVWEAEISPGSIFDLYISQKRLAVACGGNGVYVYSLDNPARPKFDFHIGAPTHEVWLGGSILYTFNRYPESGGGSSRTVLIIFGFDVTEPRNPNLVYQNQYWQYNQHNALRFLYVDEMGIKYYHSLPDGIVGPKTIVPYDRVRSIPLGLFAYKDHAYVTYNDALVVYDLSNVAGVIENATLTADSITKPAFQDGDRFYLQAGQELLLYGLVYPDSPELIEKIPVPFTPDRIVNGVAFALSESQLLFSSLHGSDAGQVHSYPIGALPVNQIIADNDIVLARSVIVKPETQTYDQSYYLFHLNGDGKLEWLSRLDVLDPVEPLSIYSSGIMSPNDLRQDFWMENNVVAIATHSGVQVYDISDPTNPKKAALLPVLNHGGDRDIWPKQFTLLHKGFFHANDFNVETQQRGWLVYSLQDPYRPEVVKRLPYDDNIDVRVSAFANDVFYYVNRQDNKSSIDMIDFTNPAQPILLESVGLKGDNYVTLSANQKYLVLGQNFQIDRCGIDCFDLSDPRKPSLKYSWLPTNNRWISKVILSGDILWHLTTNESMGLRRHPQDLLVYDLSSSDPSQVLGDTSISSSSGAIAYPYSFNTYLFLPNNQDGLKIFRWKTKQAQVIDWRRF